MKIQGSKYLPMLALTACVNATDAESIEQLAIHGEDDRIDVHEHPSELLRSRAGSVAALHLTSRLDETDPENVLFESPGTLGEDQSLCDTERFRDQTIGATCTATLVEANVLLTAAHCVESADACDEDHRWVFGFETTPGGELSAIRSDDIYTCTRVIAIDGERDVDYAFIELDRPVVGRDIVPVSRIDGPLALGDSVSTVSFPSGLPAKIDSGGQVVWSSFGEDYLDFRNTLDAFPGSSGAPVFDEAGEIRGVLRGGPSRVYELQTGGCRAPVAYDWEEGGSIGSTYIAAALRGLCEAGHEGPLCDGEFASPEIPSGNTCDDAIELDFASQEVALSLSQHSDDSSSACGGAGGPDLVYSMTADASGTIEFGSDGSNAVVYVQTSCDSEEVGCSALNRTATLDVTEGETYFFFVDMDEDSDARLGSFSISIEGESGGDAGVDAGTDGGVDAGGADAGILEDEGGCSAGGSAPRGLFGLTLALLFFRRRR